jgi:AraC-like DNA-binding protein
MKPIIERLNKEPKSSFVLQKDSYNYYPTPWHHHPEYELVLVTRSTGTKIVGDYISNFKEGDLTFIGPYLPHVYKNDDVYYSGSNQLKAEAIVIHFTDDFLGDHFFEIPEMNEIMNFFNEATNGYEITGKTQALIIKKMHNMFRHSNSMKVIELLTIFDLLSRTSEKKELATPGFIRNYKISGSKRISEVCEYIMDNFNSDITLNQVAKIANMTPNAFCHFFKSCTRKSFIRFLNEIRIGHACKLLTENKLNISEICYKSGFKNSSNFNRQFKKIMHKSPKQFQYQFYSIYDK